MRAFNRKILSNRSFVNKIISSGDFLQLDFKSFKLFALLKQKKVFIEKLEQYTVDQIIEYLTILEQPIDEAIVQQLTSIIYSNKTILLNENVYHNMIRRIRSKHVRSGYTKRRNNLLKKS